MSSYSKRPIRLSTRLHRLKRRLVKKTGAFLSHVGFRRLFYNKAISVHDLEIHGRLSYYRQTSSAEAVYLKLQFTEEETCFVSPQTFTCGLRDVQLHVGSGVLADGNRLVIESAMELSRLERIAPWNGRVVEPHRRIKTGASIWNQWGINHGHWTTDCLPRLYGLEHISASESIPLIMPDTLEPYQQRALELCLPSGFHVEYLRPKTWVQVDDFHFPSFAVFHYRTFLPEPHRNYIRGRIFQGLGLSETAPRRKRVYISRARSRWRRVINEDEVCALLAQYGFESYCLEDLSFDDQVKLFHSAEMIVGPAGSGFTNLLFAGPIPVLVLYPCEVLVAYYFLAQSLGQHYASLVFSQDGPHADFRIDVAVLEKKLETMLAARQTHRLDADR